MSAISDDGKYIQLWDLLDDIPTEEYPEALEARRQKGLEAKAALNAVARTQGQELALRITDEGWVIEVFSCYSLDEKTVKILIPKDRSRAIEIHPAGEAVSIFNK